MRHLGLVRGTVDVVTYDPAWPGLFNEEKRRLLNALGPEISEIEHIGSTAIPSLAAKPLIDMMVAIDSLTSYKQYIEPLQELDYEYMSERVFSDRIFLPKGPRTQRTHHLSLVERDSPQWTNALRFRDYLRTNSNIRQEYEALKKRLARQYPHDRNEYTKAKHDFIEHVLGRQPNQPLAI